MQTTIEYSQAFSWRLLSFRMAQSLLLFAVILLPTGAGFMNDVLIATVVFALLSGQVFEKWKLIHQLRTTQWTLLFSLLLLIGVFYTQGSVKYAWQGFVKYEKILFFIAYFPLLLEKQFRDLLLNIFILSALVSILIIMTGLVEPEPLINAIDSAFIVGVSSFLLLRKSLDAEKGAWIYGVLFAFVAAYLLLYNVERTGYLIFLGGLGIVFWQQFRWRGFVVGLALIVPFVLTLYSFNPSFAHRIDEGLQEARGYVSNEAKTSRAIGKRLGLITEAYKLPEANDFSTQRYPALYDAYLSQYGFLHEEQWFLHPHAEIRLSSIGLRLGFMEYSWREIIKHPILGNGTGSFYDVYWAGGGPTIGDTRLGHPHNEYVLILFQFGAIGLLIFLLWQYALWRDANQLPQAERFYLQGLLVCFALLGLCNASLFVNPSGVVFVILFSVFLAAKKDERERLWKLQ